MDSNDKRYRGRIAPTPSGYLHLGHARTFWIAQERALARQGELVLRVEDLDPQRSKPEYLEAIEEDLKWFGFRWNEGPDLEGGHAPYQQSRRTSRYRLALSRLIETNQVFRCYCSRKDILAASQAPHVGDEGPIYPGTCRRNTGVERAGEERPFCWRFRVPADREIQFVDKNLGPINYRSNHDFGDFVVWRQDGVPAYQLAVTVDDHEMGITEVVRGEDLLVSTARQILIFEALGWAVPDYYHCPLLCDANGERLAKRANAMSLRELRANGDTPEEIRGRFG